MTREEKIEKYPLEKISEAKTVGDLKMYVELYSIKKSFVDILQYDRNKISLIFNSTYDDNLEFLPLFSLSNNELEKHKKQIESNYSYDDRYDDDDFTYNIGYYEAQQKNESLIFDLMYKRTNCLGIGTNKLKRRLNKLIKQGNDIAKAYRLAFETEDVNIQAKNCYGKYRTKKYEQKVNLIHLLISVFVENNWVFGYHNTNNYSTNYIIFFELPNCEQISFHVNINIKGIPKYEKEWDGKINSTLDKLCKAIELLYPEIIY